MDTKRGHDRTVTPCRYFPPCSVYLHLALLFLSSSTITTLSHKINSNPTLKKSVLMFTCVI